MDYYKNAKLEDIICQPITPAYDGLADEFVSFMNHLDLHRQDEAWAPAIYLTHNGNTCNLLKQFVNITEESMTTMALAYWNSPTVAVDKTTVDHPTFSARCLAHVILGSLTPDFHTTIINRIEHKLQNDAPLLLWTIGTNIHCNDVPKYLAPYAQTCSY
jgi:hypothetical protein